MKRSKKSTRAMRHRTNAERGTGKGNSRYAQKVARGQQMYGPGCCAHEISDAAVAAAKARAAKENAPMPYRVREAA